MSGFDNLKKRISAAGGSIRAERLMHIKHRIDESFESSPAYISDGVQLWGSDRKIFPQIYEHKLRQTSPPQRGITTRLGEPFAVGDVVVMPDMSNWLCIDSSGLHGLCYTGTLQFCQYTLHVLDSNGTILKIPVCSKNTTMNGSGDKETEMLTVGVSRHLLFVPYTDETILFDNDSRFLLDRNLSAPTAYRITQVDPISYASGPRGYLQWTITETRRNDKRDNYELMIADYWPDSSDDAGDGSESGWL